MDWYSPSTTFSAAIVKSPFTIVPFWNARGDAAQGVMSTGVLTVCNPSNQRTQCVGIQWPWDQSSWDQQHKITRGSWHGALLENSRDKSGFTYARNRYYDPATGRFTQEDPIGLAGGINLYGFASGDPINLRDPFGLKSCEEWSTAISKRVKRIKNLVRQYFYWHDVMQASTQGHATAIEKEKNGLRNEEEEFDNDDECQDPKKRQEIKEKIQDGWKWGNRELPKPYKPMDLQPSPVPIFAWSRFRWSSIRQWLIPELRLSPETSTQPTPGLLPSLSPSWAVPIMIP